MNNSLQTIAFLFGHFINIRNKKEADSKVSRRTNMLSYFKKISRRCRKSTQIKKKSANISYICGRFNNTYYKLEVNAKLI